MRNERRGDGGVVLALGHLPQHVALARRQFVQRRLLDARLSATSASTTFGSITEPPSATVTDRGDELLDVLDALLQQVRAPRGTALEERERVARAPSTG